MSKTKYPIPQVSSLVKSYGDSKGFALTQSPYIDTDEFGDTVFKACAISPKSQDKILADEAAGKDCQLKDYQDCILTWAVTDEELFEDGGDLSDCADWDEFKVKYI